MIAKNIMTREVITIRAETTVAEIAQLLNQHRIGGLPVVDDENRVIGIVSESDLFLKEKGFPFSAVKVPMLFKQWADPARLPQLYEDARHHTAADVMTSEVVCVEAEESIGDIALLMVQRKVNRVPVLHNGVLVGIITRTDIVRRLAGGGA